MALSPLPITVDLQAIPGKTFAITKGDKSYTVWYYDPRNRVTTPRTTNFTKLEELLAEMTAFLVGTSDDDPKIIDTLKQSVRWGELIRLDHKARSYASGGYITADPAEPRFNSKNPDASRIIIDKTKAEVFEAEAKYLRNELLK